jgi:hypothetical protein
MAHDWVIGAQCFEIACSGLIFQGQKVQCPLYISTLEDETTTLSQSAGYQSSSDMNRTEQDRTGQDRTEQNRTEQNRTEQNRTEYIKASSP